MPLFDFIQPRQGGFDAWFHRALRGLRSLRAVEETSLLQPQRCRDGGVGRLSQEERFAQAVAIYGKRGRVPGIYPDPRIKR